LGHGEQEADIMINTHDERRIDVRVPVDLLLNKIIDGIPYACRASNISRGGLLIHRINEPLGLLDQSFVGLQFQIPGDDHVITCMGQVIYEHDWLTAHGVLFTQVDPQHQVLIAQFISDRVMELTS
jgi:hypothetical protein